MTTPSATHRPASHTASQLASLARSEAVLLRGDPPRTSRVAFWRTDGAPPLPHGDEELEELTVALPCEDGSFRAHTVPAAVLTVSDALPVLTRARRTEHEHRHRQRPPAAVFWGAAALLALRFAAQGRLLPGLSPAGYDAWRPAPLGPAENEALRQLAASMPAHAYAVPLPAAAGSPSGASPLLLPAPEEQIRAFLDAVADVLPRTPAADLATGHPAFAALAPQHIPEQQEWAADVAAGHDAGVRLSLRIEVAGLPEEDVREAPSPADESAAAGPKAAPDAGAAPGVETAPGVEAAPDAARFRAVLQLHSLTDPGIVADAAEVWPGASRSAEAFGPRVRTDTLLTLRRAAAAWGSLTPLLSAPAPDRVELDDEEISELLSAPVTEALQAAGVEVHWPGRFARDVTTRAVITADSGTGRRADADGPPSGLPSLPGAGTLLGFDWRLAVGGTELTAQELEQLAETGRPLARLRGRWVLIDPAAVRRVSRRRHTGVTPLDALGAALTGTTEAGGELYEVRASGPLESLRSRLSELSDPHSARVPAVRQPEALHATLRDYQLRGLDWLETMTSLGLGACLADDMGLGKTVTLIALHLHRQLDPVTSGPTLVVCPASLLGNWQRETERFAPGTPVRRYHGPSRSLEGLEDGEFVLTTYGTIRLDAARLASLPGERSWGLVVADEAQHVKNPFSATARALRTVPGGARVALTGTPVENNLSELWSVLDWATPGLLGRLGTFRRRYAEAAEGGDPAGAERLARLVRPFLLRRRKSDPGVAPELPPKTETDRAVSLTAEQAGLYEAVVREGLAELGGTGGFARRGLVVKLLTSLKQICNHPAQYLKEDAPTLAGRSGKLELLDELLEAILAGEDPGGVLVFTQYVRMARLLQRHLTGRGVPSLLLHGGTPVAQREEMVRDFQDGGAPVFLLSLKAAGTGLNLTRATHVVHYDRWWNPAVEAQATDRAYRIGQDKAVQVHRLITEGTVEDRIAAMLERKQALADAVLGSGEAALTELSDSELADLVGLRRSHT
ncbi:helicase SNF2 [Streptomyces abyssalis]|uniref:Helicase SNF2 n=1 Tax=Streptomyces abyssalis TaxID=933944 RepID=A0A1E7JT26_9ACTN|nr:helicase SNF2 [Streptomyces abyssalis]OEU94667.1 helicase SNF2 [Streptomyces abyssalis]